MKKLHPHEQAVLFQYIFEGKQLPKWAKGEHPQIAVFARLMNKDVKWAKAAYERAHYAGYLDKGGAA